MCNSQVLMKKENVFQEKGFSFRQNLWSPFGFSVQNFQSPFLQVFGTILPFFWPTEGMGQKLHFGLDWKVEYPIVKRRKGLQKIPFFCFLVYGFGWYLPPNKESKGVTNFGINPLPRILYEENPQSIFLSPSLKRLHKGPLL